MYLCLFSVENVDNIITCPLFNRFKKRLAHLVNAYIEIFGKVLFPFGRSVTYNKIQRRISNLILPIFTNYLTN